MIQRFFQYKYPKKQQHARKTIMQTPNPVATAMLQIKKIKDKLPSPSEYARGIKVEFKLLVVKSMVNL